MANPESINLSGKVTARRALVVVASIITLLVGGFFWMVNGGRLPKRLENEIDAWLWLIIPLGITLVFGWASNWRGRLYGGKGGIVVSADDPDFVANKKLKRREMTAVLVFVLILLGLAVLAHVRHW